MSVVHLHTEGPGPHLAPEMARPLPSPGAVHRAQRAPRRQRGPGRLRARVPVRRARGCSQRRPAARRGARQRHAARCPRVLLARDLGRGDARGDRRRNDGDRPAQPRRCRGRSASASSTSTTSTSRSRSTSRRPRVPRPAIGDVERRIGALRRGPRPRRRDAPARASARSRRRRPRSSTASATSGIHTEMFTDAVVDLVEAGVVTGAAKERNRGKIVTAFMMGTPRLYDFVDDNPMVEMRPVDFTNDTHVIRSFSRMTAINSAIEVDLTGQVVADSIGHRMYSGVGGQMDFIRGAALAPEGRRDHRAAVDRRPAARSRGSSPALQRGGGRRHDARPRPDGRDRVRASPSCGAVAPGAGRRAHRDRASGPSRQALPRGAAPLRPVTGRTRATHRAPSPRSSTRTHRTPPRAGRRVDAGCPPWRAGRAWRGHWAMRVPSPPWVGVLGPGPESTAADAAGGRERSWAGLPSAGRTPRRLQDRGPRRPRRSRRPGGAFRG